MSSYEKDESHLRPSSQNSNYSFNDVMASHGSLYQKHDQEKFTGFIEGYGAANYEMYEQLAMAYQSDVASQVSWRDRWAGRAREMSFARFEM